MLLPGQGRRLQGGGAHDARPAQRGLGAGPGVLQRVLREPGLQDRRAQAVPDAGDPR